MIVMRTMMSMEMMILMNKYKTLSFVLKFIYFFYFLQLFLLLNLWKDGLKIKVNPPFKSVVFFFTIHKVQKIDLKLKKKYYLKI